MTRTETIFLWNFLSDITLKLASWLHAVTINLGRYASNSFENPREGAAVRIAHRGGNLRNRMLRISK